MGLLEMYPLQNLRRNHGLEHATIHVLSETYKTMSMVGRSDLGGFTLYGHVPVEAVEAAANEALQRLKLGQRELAVHPRCGTVLATTGVLTGVVAFLTLGLVGSPNKRFRWIALPETVLGTTLAALMSQPLGMLFQERYTVSGEPGNLEITGVTASQKPRFTVYRVNTQQ